MADPVFPVRSLRTGQAVNLNALDIEFITAHTSDVILANVVHGEELGSRHRCDHAAERIEHRPARMSLPLRPLLLHPDVSVRISVPEKRKRTMVAAGLSAREGLVSGSSESQLQRFVSLAISQRLDDERDEGEDHKK